MTRSRRQRASSDTAFGVNGLPPAVRRVDEENAGYREERDDGTAEKPSPDAASQRVEGGESACCQRRSSCRHQCHEQRNSGRTGDLLNAADDRAAVRVKTWLQRRQADREQWRKQ